MKVLVFSVALGAISLITGSLSAQSVVMVAERLSESSSSQTKQVSELVMSTKTDDLPDAPQASSVNSGTSVDRSDDGRIRPAVATFVGVGCGSYVGMSYLPPGFNDLTHANQTLVFQFSRLVGSNIGYEFAPDIFRFLAEHHVPHPTIPIPEWWVTR